MGGTPKTTYAHYLKSDHWRAKRRERMAFCRQAYPPVVAETIHCCGCGRFVWEGIVEIHHRTYRNRGNEKMADLAVLCDGCHCIEHGKPTPLWYQEAVEQNLHTVSKAFVNKYRKPQVEGIGGVLERVVGRIWGVDESN